MCYVKKMVGQQPGRWPGSETNLGEKFQGQFNCEKFNCDGCNEGFVDGEEPKRNQDLKLTSFLKFLLLSGNQLNIKVLNPL